MTVGAQVDADFLYRRYISYRCFLSVLFVGCVFCCSFSFVLHGSLRPAFLGVEAFSLGFTFLAVFPVYVRPFFLSNKLLRHPVSCGPETILVSVTITARTLRLALKSLCCAFQEASSTGPASGCSDSKEINLIELSPGDLITQPA